MGGSRDETRPAELIIAEGSGGLQGFHYTILFTFTYIFVIFHNEK